jgi:hypothetical protein
VQQGQPVRIAARTWNKVLDSITPAREIVGGGFTATSFPSVSAQLAQYALAESRQVRIAEAVRVLGPLGPLVGEATLPLSLQTLPLTNDEKSVVNWNMLQFDTMRPTDGNVSPAAKLEDAIAVCVDPQSLTFAVSGFAWVRVRHLQRWHKFARRCLAQDGDGNAELDNSIGCLDSCGWGPAQIMWIYEPYPWVSDWYWAVVKF